MRPDYSVSSSSLGMVEAKVLFLHFQLATERGRDEKGKSRKEKKKKADSEKKKRIKAKWFNMRPQATLLFLLYLTPSNSKSTID